MKQKIVKFTCDKFAIVGPEDRLDAVMKFIVFGRSLKSIKDFPPEEKFSIEVVTEQEMTAWPKYVSPEVVCKEVFDRFQDEFTPEHDKLRPWIIGSAIGDYSGISYHFEFDGVEMSFSTITEAIGQNEIVTYLVNDSVKMYYDFQRQTTAAELFAKYTNLSVDKLEKIRLILHS